MPQTINFDRIISPTSVDGPGRRTALFLQGCPIHCHGCQNRHLWDPDAGTTAPTDLIASVLLATGLDLTISGGEPFYQASALAELLRTIKVEAKNWVLNPERHVVVYTGYVLEDLLDAADVVPGVVEVLELADVLVDGPYDRSLDHDGMQWRGSSNQRVIDLAATRAAGWRVVELDWDTPQIVITEDGDLLAASEYAAAFASVGDERDARRCGQTLGSER